MLLVSQNLLNYDMQFPADTVFRINLAWIDVLSDLERMLGLIKHPVFLDLPIGRMKPPHNSYSLDDLRPIVHRHRNVRYIAISNIEKPEQLEPYTEKLTEFVTIVPKIESAPAIANIEAITAALTGDERMLMLDHDDLFASLIRNNIHPNKFGSYIQKLVDYCEEQSLTLLRTRGVIFSD